MAEVFLRAGMRVVIADIRRPHLARAATELGAGDQIHCLSLDVTDREAVGRVADETLRVFGRVDVLCNNAGVGLLGDIRMVTYDDWDWCLGVNLGGFVNGVQSFLPHMLAQGGAAHIVNTSSIGAILPGPGGVPYLIAKAAIIGLSQSLRALSISALKILNKSAISVAAGFLRWPGRVQHGTKRAAGRDVGPCQMAGLPECAGLAGFGAAAAHGEIDHQAAD